MEILLDNISVTTFNNFLITYKNLVAGRDDRMVNLLDKLPRLINSENVNENKLKDLLTNIDDDTLIKNDASYASDILYVKSLLMFYPVTINMTVYEDGSGYLFANRKSFYITKSIVDMFKEDKITKLNPITYEDKNNLLDIHFNTVTKDEAYTLNTNLLMVLKAGILIDDIKTLPVHDQYAYIITYLPVEFQSLYKNYITSIRYVNDTITKNTIWIPDEFFNDLINTDIDKLKYPISRDTCDKIRLTYRTQGKYAAYKVIMHIVTSDWRDGDLKYLMEDFPYLRDLLNLTNVTFIKTLSIGLKSSMEFLDVDTNELYSFDKQEVLDKIKEKINILG